MRKCAIYGLVCLVMILGLGLPPAGAEAQTQLDCAGSDVFAMYFDNGDINASYAAFAQFNVYYAVVNATEPWVSGFEFAQVNFDSRLIVLSTVFPDIALNIGTPPDYIVGFQSPLPVQGRETIVMTQTMLPTMAEPIGFFFGPSSVPSIPGRMAYSTWDGVNDYPIIPMSPISDDFLLPVAQINGIDLDYCNSVAPLDLAVDISFDGDTDNVAGTSLGATDGFDSDYDFADANTSLTFPHPEWNQGAVNFKRDIRAAYDPTRELKQWTFVATAEGDQSGARNVTLGFQPNFVAQSGLSFELRDRDTGDVYDLFAGSDIVYTIPAGATFTHTYDLSIGYLEAVDLPLWVEVTATGNGITEAPNRLSTNSLATDGYDPGLDIPEPIHPPSKYVAASFIHNDWPLGPRFRTDARALFDPTAETKTWPLRVETDQSGTVVLDFAASFTAQDSIGLQLRDLQSGQTFNLFPQMSYMFESNGFSSYDFEIMLGLSGPPDLFPTSRQLDSGWALVGLPLRPAGRNLGQVILDQAPGYAFMFGHQPGLGYSLLNPSETALQSQGYWIGTDSGFIWTMTGNRNLGGVAVALAEGWNLVGNPLWFPGPFEGMAVIHDGVIVPWLEAVNRGLVATGVQSYDQLTGTYFNAVDLQPWQGYWIDALVPGLNLVFKWENFQAIPARMSAAKSTLPADPRIWSTALTLWDAERRQTSMTIGVDPEATTGFDSRLDMPLPPAPPSGGPVLAFSHPEWELASGSYFSRDFVPPSDGEVAWNAIVMVDEPGSANLVWDSSNWPREADFQLYLPGENRVIVASMRSQTSVRLELGSDPLPIVIRTPSLVSGVDDTPALTYRIGVHPNPFNPMTTIGFDLPKPGKAEVRLYTVRGELVGVLGGEQYGAGSHKIMWRGQDRAGRDVPSGSYFAKLYVDGQAMGPVTKMSLVR